MHFVGQHIARFFLLEYITDENIIDKFLAKGKNFNPDQVHVLLSAFHLLMHDFRCSTLNLQF